MCIRDSASLALAAFLNCSIDGVHAGLRGAPRAAADLGEPRAPGRGQAAAAGRRRPRSRPRQ
eukprot:8499958-Alexandrium_andersonii.AAC.1